MTEMTPKMLRELEDDIMAPRDGWFRKKLRAAASAWEADLNCLKGTVAALQRMSQRWADGQARIEALEKERIELCVLLRQWQLFNNPHRGAELQKETDVLLERNRGGAAALAAEEKKP